MKADIPGNNYQVYHMFECLSTQSWPQLDNNSASLWQKQLEHQDEIRKFGMRVTNLV